MAAVSVAVSKAKKLEDGRKFNNVTLTFGDGSTAYPAGGIAISGADCGCPVSLESLLFVDADAASTKLFKFDQANGKVRIYVEGAAVYAEMSGTIPAMTVKVIAVGI